MKMHKVSVKRKKGTGLTAPSLERVIGLSAKGNNGISTNPVTGDVAYTASGVIVIYNPASNKQLARLINVNCRTFACVSFSLDGRFLAAGEGACKGPKVLVWEYSPPNITLLKQLEGHRFGVERLIFSPGADLLVTVGVEHDQGLFLWNWKQEQRLTANKLSKRVYSIAFSPTGGFFVTCGQKSIQFWLFDSAGKPIVTPASEQATVKCMVCKGASLGEYRDKTFTGVAVNDKSLFAITEDGKLCTYSHNREMEKFMDLQVQGGATVQVRGNHVYCGCTDGLIRCFDAVSLEHLVTLPRPPPLGAANITTDRQRQPQQAGPVIFADTTALDLMGATGLLALYSDRTLFVWDLKRLDNVTASRALLHHSSAITDLKILPCSTNDLTQFATSSTDKTIRLWHLHHGHSQNSEIPLVRNVFSKDLTRIIYVTKAFDHLKVKRTDDGGDGSIKCISISQDSRMIASGDVTGVVRVHDLTSFREVKSWVGHDNEVVSVDYSGKVPLECKGAGGSAEFYLASCSRDRIIHVTRGESFEVVASLEDHSSSITDLKFARVGDIDRLVSCSSDKTLIFRTLKQDRTEIRTDVYQKSVQKGRKFYCLEVHPVHKEIITGEDKVLRIWDIESGKPIDGREMSDPDHTSKADSYIKVALDSSGMLAAAASLDKCVRLFDYYSNRLSAKVSVGELVNALAFTPNGEKLLTATNDGCVFVWKLPKELTAAIRTRLTNMRVSTSEPFTVESSSRVSKSEPPVPKTESKEEAKEPPTEYPPLKKLRDDSMPSWAKSIVPPEQKSVPFALKEEQPVPGKWGKNATIEFGFEDVETPPELSVPEAQIQVQLQKIAVLKTMEEVESEDEKLEEPEPKAIAEVTPAPSTHEMFSVTRSAVGIPKAEEEPLTEAFDDLRVDEEDLEDPEEVSRPEPKDQAPNPMRQSLTSTFLLRKLQAEPKPLYFVEPIPVVESDLHIPRVMDLKKKKAEGVSDLQAQIGEALQNINPILKKDRGKDKKSSNPWGKPDSEPVVETSSQEVPEPERQKFTKTRTKLALEDLLPEDKSLRGAEKEPPPETLSMVAIRPDLEKKSESKPVPKPESASNKFNTPEFHADVSSASIPEISGSVSASQFFVNARVRTSKEVYTQSFRELKQSLRDVNAFFSRVDSDDDQYSTSLQESSKDVEEIHQ